MVYMYHRIEMQIYKNILEKIVFEKKYKKNVKIFFYSLLCYIFALNLKTHSL
jgi:uncharacterized membrane protein YjjP (DUF1212 family)